MLISERMASRRVGRLTQRISAKFFSEGSFCPGTKVPSSIIWRIWSMISSAIVDFLIFFSPLVIESHLCSLFLSICMF